MHRLSAYSRNVCSVAAALLLVLLLGSEAQACPGCKNGISGEDTRNIAAGYYYSILFMISMPALIISGFSGWMYLAVRRARAEREQQTSDPADTSTAGTSGQQAE